MNDITGRGRIAAAFIILLSVAGAGSLGQEPLSPDTAVDLNEGVYLYLQALAQEGELEYYDQAIERFTSVLDADRDNRAALLFRALSHGEIGLLHRREKDSAKGEILYLEKTLEVRADPQQQQMLEQERDALKVRLADESLPPSDRLLMDTEWRRLEAILSKFAGWSGRSDEELQQFLRQRRSIRHDAGVREREAYSRMLADLDVLIHDLTDPEVVIRLLEVVGRTKVARLNEDEALEVLSGEVPSDDPQTRVSLLRDESAEIMRRTANILEEVLRTRQLSGMNAVRVKFFLGVVRFRQGVPRRAPDEAVQPDTGYLLQAEKIMQELVDDPEILDTWRSYAALYLGLIIPFRAAGETDPDLRNALYDRAEGALRQSIELDTRVPIDAETGEPDPQRVFSASGRGKMIPLVVLRQREQIADLRQRAPSAPQRRNDIEFSFFFDTHYDTNVVLLGERTDLPRDIPKEGDYGFTTGTVLTYTLDLSDHWTLGLEGRAASLWHCEVDEFDEQDYGGSAALQYEMVPKKGEFGPIHLRLQYDYNYSLLGRSAFLESHSLTPNMRVFWDDRRAQADVYFTYEWRDYREPLYDRRYNRDGEYLALGLFHSYKLLDMTPRYENAGIEPWGHAGDDGLAQDDPDYPAHYLSPYMGLQYAWDCTDGDEFDQKSYILSLGVMVPLPWGVELDTGVDFEWQEYQHGSLIDYHRRPRRDFIQRYEVGLSRTFVLRGGELANRHTPAFDRVLMILRAYAAWTLDDSNVVDRLGEAVFEYDRAMYGIAVAFTFN
jgi:hypothetical protein